MYCLHNLGQFNFYNAFYTDIKLFSMFLSPIDNLHYEKFSDGTVKCIEDEIPFELPEAWTWCRVQTIASVKGGKRVPKGYAVTDEKTNHIYIRVTDMKNSTIMLDDLKYISDEVYSQISNYVISKDDIYVTIAGTIGNVGEVPDELDGMNLTENAAKVCNISIDKSFLCKVLSSEFVQKQFRFQTHQVTMAKLALERILDTLIPIAPIDEQTKISRIIDDLSAKIYEIQNSNNNLQALISATKFKILDLAIRGKLVPQDPNDEPASVLLEHIRAEKEELIKQGKIKRDKKESVIFKGDDNSYYEKIGNDVTCIDNEIPFEIPDNWCWARLSQLSSQIFAGGDKPKIFSKEYTEKCTVPIYSNGIENNGLYGYTDLPRVTEKSLTISARGTIGFACVRNEPFVPIIRLLTIVPATGVYAEYIKCVFQYFLESGKGSSIPQLTVPEIKPKLIPVPPGKEQSKIVKRIDIVFSILNTLEPNSA